MQASTWERGSSLPQSILIKLSRCKPANLQSILRIFRHLSITSQSGWKGEDRAGSMRAQGQDRKWLPLSHPSLLQTELIGGLKLGNVWVFLQLIHRPNISCTKAQTLHNLRYYKLWLQIPWLAGIKIGNGPQKWLSAPPIPPPTRTRTRMMRTEEPCYGWQRNDDWKCQSKSRKLSSARVECCSGLACCSPSIPHRGFCLLD